ncbi:hypothetical protein ACWGBY_20840 [Streptomyces griseus]|uniref:hypothetical protein n=1 Tax=Streptomyces griseus TaxID=1911 RepID=UPI0037AA3BF5
MKLLLEATDGSGRWQVLREHEERILEDLKESLAQVDHPDLEGLVSFAVKAKDCASAGHTEAATALAANVLDSALEMHESHIYDQLRFSLVGVKRRSPRRHLAGKIAAEVPQDGGREHFFTSGGLMLLMAAYGLHGVFDAYRWPKPPDPKFNRNMLAHRVGADTYQPLYVLHALLLTNALLRWLDIQVPRESDHPDE